MKKSLITWAPGYPEGPGRGRAAHQDYPQDWKPTGEQQVSGLGTSQVSVSPKPFPDSWLKEEGLVQN